MRILFLLLIVSSTVLFTSCQKDEDQAKPSEVTFASLENEYGIKFYEADDTDSSAITMSLEELKHFLDEYKEGKTFQGKVVDAESVSTKGRVENGTNCKLLIEDKVYLTQMFAYKMVAEFYLMENYFNFDVCDLNIPLKKYYSAKKQTTIYSNMYDNVSYFSLVKDNIKFSVEILLNGKVVRTDFSFRVQIDWAWQAPTCQYSIFHNL